MVDFCVKFPDPVGLHCLLCLSSLLYLLSLLSLVSSVIIDITVHCSAYFFKESTDEESEIKWVPPHDPICNLTSELLLFRASRAHNLPVMLEALALGANIEWRHSEEGLCPPIHQAIMSGSVMSTELLILNGAAIDSTDKDGNTALHLAALHGFTGQVCLLLKHRSVLMKM